MPAIAISMQGMIFLLATQTVDRDPPAGPPEDPSPPTASYPSGHVGASTAFYVVVRADGGRAIERDLAAPHRDRLCLAMPLLVALARLYRGTHHVTDVVLGILNGAVCALLAYGWYRHRTRSSGSTRAKVRSTVG